MQFLSRARYSVSLRLAAGALLLSTTLATARAADPVLPDIFSEGMVLQREMPIPVWGQADDGTEVTVKLGSDSATATAADGRWEVKLPARKASTEPLTMTISYSGGAPAVTLGDILVGEVWLCAGQSNMAGLVGGRPPRDLQDMPHVRQFSKLRGKDSRLPPAWRTATGEDRARFSNTAIYFAEYLHKKLNVPIGLILTAVSGTPIENWTPKQALESDPQIKALLDKGGDREVRDRIRDMQKAMKEGDDSKADEELLQIAKLSRAGGLYSGLIEPTVPFAIRGAIWYQGEANSNDPNNASEYGKYLTLLISGLRQAYQQPNLPFYIVQLPSIDDGKDRGTRVYEIVRQEQLETVKALPNTGLAVSIDVNEGLHPRSKFHMGDRLGQLAVAEVYGQKSDGAYAGPLLDKVSFDGGKAICTFTHAEGGLELKESGDNLFEIAGADGNFHPAEATVEGSKLILSNPQVKAAEAVRYAFRPAMEQVSLFGATGLPASPFVFPAP